MAVYAVRSGRQTGIFNTWLECSKVVLGVSCCEYKKCKDEQEANEYLGIIPKGNVTGLTPVVMFDNNSKGEQTEEVKWTPPSRIADGEAIAYTDGSYNERLGKFSYGCVFTTNKGKMEFYGADDNTLLLPLRNVAGELLAVMLAVKKAKELGCKKLKIYHDYNGVANWVKGLWCAKSRVTQAYVEFMKQSMLTLPIEFQWIKGHTGVFGGDRADALAREALYSKMTTDSLELFGEFRGIICPEIETENVSVSVI